MLAAIRSPVRLASMRVAISFPAAAAAASAARARGSRRGRRLRPGRSCPGQPGRGARSTTGARRGIFAAKRSASARASMTMPSASLSAPAAFCSILREQGAGLPRAGGGLRRVRPDTDGALRPACLPTSLGTPYNSKRPITSTKPTPTQNSGSSSISMAGLPLRRGQRRGFVRRHRVARQPRHDRDGGFLRRLVTWPLASVRVALMRASAAAMSLCSCFGRRLGLGDFRVQLLAVFLGQCAWARPRAAASAVW